MVFVFLLQISNVWCSLMKTLSRSSRLIRLSGQGQVRWGLSQHSKPKALQGTLCNGAPSSCLGDMWSVTITSWLLF